MTPSGSIGVKGGGKTNGGQLEEVQRHTRAAMIDGYNRTMALIMSGRTSSGLEKIKKIQQGQLSSGRLEDINYYESDFLMLWKFKIVDSFIFFANAGLGAGNRNLSVYNWLN